MRDFLDDILEFIGSESLTDDEFESLDVSSQTYTNANYLALVGILEARESISSMLDRLKYYFMAKGVTIESVDSGQSNILVGGVLE